MIFFHGRQPTCGLVSLPLSRELSRARTSLVCEPSMSLLILSSSASYTALSGFPEPVTAAIPLRSVLEGAGDEGTVLVGVTLALRVLAVPLLSVDLTFGAGILARRDVEVEIG